MKTLLRKIIGIASSFYLLVIFLGGNLSSANAQIISEQPSNSIAMLSDYVEKLYGSDDILISGRPYLPDHYNAKKNPYFLFDNFTKGTLIINGKNHEEQEILYNIDTEQLILKTSANNNQILLVLNNEFIDSFYLDKRFFINGAKYIPENKFSGFVEQVYCGNFSLLIHHQKSFFAQYTIISPNGYYSDTKSTNYILKDGTLTKLTTKKTFFKYFSSYKREIKNYMHINKIKYYKADNKQLHKLFEYCDNISLK